MRGDKPRWLYRNARERTNNYRGVVPKLPLYKLGPSDGTPWGQRQPNRNKFTPAKVSDQTRSPSFSQDEKTTRTDVHKAENNAHMSGRPGQDHRRFNSPNVPAPSSSSTIPFDPDSSGSWLADVSDSAKKIEVSNYNGAKQLLGHGHPFDGRSRPKSEIIYQLPSSSETDSGESSVTVPSRLSVVKRDQATETDLGMVEISAVFKEVTRLRDLVKQLYANHSVREKELESKISMLEEINRKIINENSIVKHVSSSKKEVECIVLD